MTSYLNANGATYGKATILQFDPNKVPNKKGDGYHAAVVQSMDIDGNYKVFDPQTGEYYTVPKNAVYKEYNLNGGFREGSNSSSDSSSSNVGSSSSSSSDYGSSSYYGSSSSYTSSSAPSSSSNTSSSNTSSSNTGSSNTGSNRLG